MRGNAEAHELIAPGSLPAVLDLLAAAPGEWTPIAGGTELMVAFAAGRLGARKLVNLWGIPDLRFIEATPESFVIGACTTFLDLRGHAGLAAELPLLAKSASWIGSIANQSRATLGGNLVNGSPAADSSPALLVYDAEIEIVSERGKPPRSLLRIPHRLQAQCARRRMNCFTRFTCRGDSRITGSTCAKWERAAPWRSPRSRWPQLRCLQGRCSQRNSPRSGEPCAISRAPLQDGSRAARPGHHERNDCKLRDACTARRSAAHRRHSLHRRIPASASAANLLQEFLLELSNEGAPK